MPFDALSYLAANTDLLRAGITVATAEQHYLSYGIRESRSTTFDTYAYIAANSDLISAFGTNTSAALSHYVTTGYRESRTTSFNAYEYIASNSDLISAFGTNTTSAEIHYITNGYSENRSTTSFNAGAYIAANSDLRSLGSSTAALQHYISYGYRETRTTSYNFSSFDVSQYMSTYTDIYSAYTDPTQRYQQALDHYINYGIFEGRTVTVSAPVVVATTTRLSDTNGSTTDSLGVRGERDSFQVTLNAGTQYTMQLRGRDSNGGTLSDPYLRLYDSRNNLLTSDDDSGTGLDSRIVYTPSTTGTYYLTAGAYADAGTGTYTLSVSRPTNTTVLSTSDSISARGERDSFTVNLTANQAYRFDMQGRATNAGTLSDPYLRLLGTTGSQVAYNDDSNGTLNSQILYTPTTSGRYTLVAGAYADNGTGTYTLSAVAVS